jgi:YQGE family putative transporter
MALMMLTKNPDLGGVMISGLIMGFSYGFFWANRNFLALTSTNNDNRNYYYGLETFLSALSVIIVPFAAGLFIAAVPAIKWIGGNVNAAYYIITGGVFILTLTAAYLAHQGRFKNPTVAPKLYLEFHTIWDKTLGLSALRGLAWGYIIAAPVMLIMKLVGSEGSLGLIQSAGALLSAIMLYVLGRKTRPEHRLRILRFGLFLFLTGSIVNSAAYNAVGVIIFLGCLVFARPLLDLAYYPIQLGVIEFLAKKEGRNQFTYLFTNEVATYMGRLAGCGLFILSSRYVSDYWALRYAMLFVALIYSCSWLVARSILNDPAWKEPVKSDQQTLDQLKEPIEL